MCYLYILTIIIPRTQGSTSLFLFNRWGASKNVLKILQDLQSEMSMRPFQTPASAPAGSFPSGISFPLMECWCKHLLLLCGAVNENSFRLIITTTTTTIQIIQHHSTFDNNKKKTNTTTTTTTIQIIQHQNTFNNIWEKHHHHRNHNNNNTDYTTSKYI